MSSIKFAADENFNNAILRGLRRHKPKIDIIRIQDTSIYQADDDVVLEWCATEKRVLLTHDVKTMPKYVYERIEAEKVVSGVFLISDGMAIGQVIEELLLIIEVSDPKEWENIILYFPI